MSEIKNSKYINITSGSCRITVLAEDTATQKVNVFSALVSTPDGGISLPLDTTLGRTRELNDVYNSAGNFAGTTTGNEVVNDKSVNLNFADDFVYLSDTAAGMEVNRNMILNLALGESFSADLGSGESIQSIVGTNGTVKRTKRAFSGLDFGLLFNEIGKLKVPQAKTTDGKPVLEQNVRVTGYSTSALTVMFEAFTEFDANHKQGLCFAYVLNGNAEWSEDTDYNKLSMEGQILCDVRYTNGFFINGFGFDNSTNADGFKFKVVSGIVDDTPAADEIAVGVDGTVTFGSNHNIADFPVGTVIWSPASTVTGVDQTNLSYYMVVRENTGSVATLGSFIVNVPCGNTSVRPTDDAGAYIAECFDFDFETSSFARIGTSGAIC